MSHECMLCGPTINSKLMIIYLNGNDSIYYSFKPIVNTWYETELTVYYVIVKEINFTINGCLIRKKYYIALK